ncbi:MAG TPA: penicillin-binding transpeptidase domain-containing protein [Trebonia sp.]|nr:penicillin-binding transpeptidase domain-containing protein [Trebonia sp.]
MGGVRSRSARARVVAAACATAVLLLGLLLGWATPQPSVEGAVQDFLLDWENGQYSAAAALTTGSPAQVAGALRGAYQQVGAAALSLSMVSVTQRGTTAKARFSADIDLGRGGAPWDYDGSFPLRRVGSGWKVVWSPSVIVPGLRPGLRLAVVGSTPPRAQLLDAQGNPLAPLSTVYTVGVIPGRLANPARTASGLAAVTGLVASQILSWIDTSPAGGFLELVRFPPAAYHRLSARLHRVPGLKVERQRVRLFGSIASAVTGTVGSEAAKELQQQGIPFRPGTTEGLSGLQFSFQRMLVGTPTTEVVLQNAAGQVVSVLKDWPGQSGTNVRTTIDAGVQRAANNVLDSLPTSAALVAVSASNGHVLAVSEHNVRGMPSLQPLSGRYQPGQAFTVVSAAALLGTGLGLAAPIPCGPSNPVGGETFVNAPPEAALRASFRVDFANACSTAFAGLSLKLTGKKLQQAADGFGLGKPWQLPVSSFSGAMGLPTGQAQLAEDAIGQGSVKVSLLDMAIAAAVVQSGTWYPPSLVTSPPDPGLTPTRPFNTQVLSGLQTLMHDAVTNGAARSANVPGQPVYGQVGSAPLGAGGLRTAWFVGFQGNVAFAVVEVVNSAGISAAPAAGQFLSQVRA